MVVSASLARPASSPADELIGSIHDVMQSVLRVAHPALEAEGISKGQFWALHLVSSLGSARVGTIAQHLAVSAPTVCVAIDELEAAGLVMRQRSQRDRRAVELSLTPKGRKVEARVWAILGRRMGEAAATLPTEEVASASRVLRQIADRLSKERVP